MKKYIELDAARRAILRHAPQAAFAMDEIPSADVRPVVRGKWRERRFSEDIYGAECSVCHTTWDYGTNFCPNCGADMRSEIQPSFGFSDERKEQDGR